MIDLQINLQLVGYCNASCSFCPRNDYKRNPEFYMPMKLVRKISDEVKTKSFRSKYNVVEYVIGENGESTLHPSFIDILRILKRSEPGRIILYTNFSFLFEEDLKVIIEEKLLYGIACNIDGLTKESYRIMKGLDLDIVEDNIKTFIKMKKGSGIVLEINVLTAENYINAVRSHYGIWPHAIPQGYVPISDEANKIVEKWKPILSNIDGIGISRCLMWAEREFVEKKPGDWDCFNRERFNSNVFIAPNGDWYVCCFDFRNELVFGNLYENTIDEIYEGDRRKKLVDLIRSRKFEEVGYPCKRVDSCQLV